MKIQLWSYNYDPEPSGIAPLAGVVSRALSERGHQVEVVAAHPHYPEPRWGKRLRPYREIREGIPVVRLPLWIGRSGAAQRIRQEATYAAALAAAAPALGKPDVILAVSPSFPGLGPAMGAAAVRRVPWVLWLQDILPDGALASGVISDGALIGAARAFERRAYRSARHVVVISDSFADNLAAKGVPAEKMTRIYNPSSHGVAAEPRPAGAGDGVTVLNMGNIGHTQNLEAVTRWFQASPELERMGARFVMAGDGVAGDTVRRAIETDRVTVTGVLERPELDAELDRASVALVSQSYEGIDFNVPSKLMSFMATGLPVVATVREESEVARIVRSSGGGWVISDADGEALGPTIAAALSDPAERARRGEAALRFAQQHFDPASTAQRLEAVLADQTSALSS